MRYTTVMSLPEKSTVFDLTCIKLQICSESGCKLIDLQHFDCKQWSKATENNDTVCMRMYEIVASKCGFIAVFACYNIGLNAM